MSSNSLLTRTIWESGVTELGKFRVLRCYLHEGDGHVVVDAVVEESPVNSKGEETWTEITDLALTTKVLKQAVMDMYTRGGWREDHPKTTS